MSAELEIIIPLRNPDAQLSQTIASLAAQTDKQFGVLLSGNFCSNGTNQLDTAQRQLVAAHVPVRRIKSLHELRRIEHLNWTYSQTQAEWLKLLLPGEQLKANFVEQIKTRVAARPNAQLIRCDAELRTDWGNEILPAPFSAQYVSPAEFINYFPSHTDWLSRSLNFACTRTAWLATGGFATHLAASAALNSNVILALHHGVENIPETLVSAEFPGNPGLNGNSRERVNHSLELWLTLRQAANYCRSAKLPWTAKWLFLRSLTAAMGRWQP